MYSIHSEKQYVYLREMIFPCTFVYDLIFPYHEETYVTILSTVRSGNSFLIFLRILFFFMSMSCNHPGWSTCIIREVPSRS